MPATPQRRRRVPGLVVVAALVLALGVVCWATSVLLRPPLAVEDVAVERATDEIVPGPGVPAEQVTGLHLYLVPHPDDELSGWTSLTDEEPLHPVVVVLTHGEDTASCTAETLDRRLRPELGEIEPDPVPDGSEARCREARVGALRAALDEAAEHSPVVEGLGARPGNELQLAGGPARLTTTGHASLVVLDLGDGRLKPDTVQVAVEEVLARAGQELPDLPLARVTASAYHADPSSDQPTTTCDRLALCPADDIPFDYHHADHHAVREAARQLADQAEQGAWLVTTPTTRPPASSGPFPRTSTNSSWDWAPASPPRPSGWGATNGSTGG